MAWVLFYKRLVTLGGAEVLLGQHYSHLKARNEDVTVICFEVADLERIAIDPEDLVVLPGHGAIAKTRRLAVELKRRRNARMICHSGYIEFGAAAILAGVPFGIFVHQPTTMSYNEQDKFAARFWPRFREFARRDVMYERLCERRAALSPTQRIYIELRSILSQTILRRADALFVLSHYAVREKAQIFGLKATHLSGALPAHRVEALAAKPDLRACGDPIELVSVSRLDENKRIGVLIEAVAELRARGRSVRLRLGGAGPAMAGLKDEVQLRGLCDCVEFLGFVPEADIAALHAGSDLFVTIDWADYRITTYEVLAEHRRVIVSDDTDVDPELLESGYLFASAPNALALADTIERALATPVSWERERLAAYLTKFTWPVYFDAVAAALEHRDVA